MQDIIYQFNQARGEKNLFDFWEKELSCREELRKRDTGTGIIVSTPDELEFLLRSLYYGERRPDFFKILFDNLDKIVVIKWLLKAPSPVLSGLLRYIPWLAESIQPQPEQYQFLIHLFREEYQADFIAIIYMLNLNTCKSLLLKTGNPYLRSLLKARIASLEKQSRQIYYRLPEKDLPDHDCLYGSKTSLLHRAISSIENNITLKLPDPHGEERFQLHLESAHLVFQSGLVEDALLMLLEVYEDYAKNSRLVDILADERIYKQMSRLLRKVIPLNALLYYSPEAMPKAAGIYRNYFERITPEPGSLAYLELWDGILEAQAHDTHNLYELLSISSKIGFLRPGETVFFNENDIKTGYTKSRLAEIIAIIEQKKLALPHETFITMEIMRLLARAELLVLDENAADSMLGKYLEFWKWIPCTLFMNENIFRQIASSARKNLRKQCRQILDITAYYQKKDLADELCSRPHLFLNKEARVRRDLLTARFLGV